MSHPPPLHKPFREVPPREDNAIMRPPLMGVKRYLFAEASFRAALDALRIK
jgi:hypothetical protein